MILASLSGGVKPPLAITREEFDAANREIDNPQVVRLYRATQAFTWAIRSARWCCDYEEAGS